MFITKMEHFLTFNSLLLIWMVLKKKIIAIQIQKYYLFVLRKDTKIFLNKKIIKDSLIFEFQSFTVVLMHSQWNNLFW